MDQAAFGVWNMTSIRHDAPSRFRKDPEVRIAELEAEITRLKEQLAKIAPDSQVVERTKK